VYLSCGEAEQVKVLRPSRRDASESFVSVRIVAQVGRMSLVLLSDGYD
jgi:hypothetical protein